MKFADLQEKPEELRRKYAWWLRDRFKTWPLFLLPLETISKESLINSGITKKDFMKVEDNWKEFLKEINDELESSSKDTEEKK